MASWLNELLQRPDADNQLINRRNGAVIAETVRGAFDSASRRRGLLGRDEMPAGEALIIAPTNAIHTWFVRFDINLAFVNKSGLVLKTRQRMGPWRMAAALKAHAVIELASGTLAAADTVAGDSLGLELKYHL